MLQQVPLIVKHLEMILFYFIVQPCTLKITQGTKLFLRCYCFSFLSVVSFLSLKQTAHQFANSSKLMLSCQTSLQSEWEFILPLEELSRETRDNHAYGV